MMERAGKINNVNFQLWQPESHPIELTNNNIALTGASLPKDDLCLNMQPVS